MKRFAALMVVVAGCGGDDSANNATPDVFVNPGPDYDLSCLNNMRTTVPTTITIESTLLDLTGNTTMPIANAMLSSYTVTDDTLLGTVTTDMDGKAMIELVGDGTPRRVYGINEAAGFVKSRHYVNIAPWASGPGLTVAVKQSRLDDLATALGATLDPTKGVLEVWSNDCSAKGELPGATLMLDGAPAQWAMYGGVGVWIPRETTLGTISSLRNGSVAGIVNVTPGVHQVTVTAEGVTMTSTVAVEAGGWSMLVMTPGHPLI